MLYLLVFCALFILELFYFRIADKFNIIDKPNERSSHTILTLRGGGIIFYFAALFHFVGSGFEYPYFFIGLTLMTIISFIDDIYTLSNKLRLFVHFVAVLLMAYELNLFDLPIFLLLIGFIIIVGVINAYNFMDGINGITVCYSLTVGSLLLLVNNKLAFIGQDFLIFMMIGLLVFGFFNFRNKARCFAGDVGSVSIAFILLYALGSLILATNNYIYILFLSVYGIDVVWTIVRRLYLKENIFEAHRSHLYQFLANEAGVNKLIVSFSYGVLQFMIGILIIKVSTYSFNTQLLTSIILLVGLSVVYLLIKAYVLQLFHKRSA